ncbi:MAG: OmpA/MotB family protein [Luteibaculaceae bacterium]
MRTLKSTIFLLATALSLSSCATLYNCGDETPEKVKGSKKFKALAMERDSLCSTLNTRNAENEELTQKLADKTQAFNTLTDNFNNLRQNFDKLTNENLSQAEQFDAALRQKSRELSEKEALLTERERALRELQATLAKKDSITNRLNEIVRNALLGFNSDELSVEIRNGKVYVSMSNKLMFNSGSANIENKGKEALQALADVLNKNDEIDILVEGHTDNVPIRTAQFRDNWDLSVARATSIVRILTDTYQVDPVRVTASGKGEFAPRATNETAEGRALNRRTEIILSPKLDELLEMLGSGK